MKSLVLLIVAVVITAGVALAGPPVIGVTNRRFDHDRHAASAQAGGKQAACGACHTVDAQGAFRLGREHDRCATCHQFAASCSVLQTAGPKGPARVCAVCHVPTRSECLPKDLPAPPKDASFSARFTHGKHLMLGTSIERDCAQCHKLQAGVDPKQPAHKLCAGCHNPQGARPAMSECASCHVAPAPALAQAADPFRLAGFDHKNHLARSQQPSCLGCHDKLVGAGDASLPRPSMLGCLTRCHDSQKAFSATGTRCTSCHKATDKATPMRTDLGFSHAQHAARNVKIAECGSCHVLEADGTLTAPGAKKDHMPCASSGCHQTEFTVRAPKICGVCHDVAVPWQKAVARTLATFQHEWFESMNHAIHLAKPATGAINAACASCHGDKLAGATAPAGHAACAPCHNRGERPAMTECAACHSTPPPPAMTKRSAWSVAPNFVHTQHAADPRTRSRTACLECHAPIATAKDLIAAPKPTMASCEGCHDGKTSFKTTGFECARCHAPPKLPPGATAVLDDRRAPLGAPRR